MKIDKEYPATHSMETAWYLADADGNVAIMEYGSDGPVPWGTEEGGVWSLVLGRTEEFFSPDKIILDLSDDQIDELMQNPHSPSEGDMWSNCFVQIDVEKRDRYLDLAQREGFSENICVSEARGLYYVECSGCTIKEKNAYALKKGSLIREMINQGIIKQVFDAKLYDIGEVWYEKKYETAPYYLYNEANDPRSPHERVVVPKNPVRLSQFPEPLRSRIPRIPIRFSEHEKVQVAEWVPCNMYTYDGERDAVMYGNIYTLMTLGNGTEAYAKVLFYPPSFFEPSQGYNYYCDNIAFTDKPTVCLSRYPLEENNYDFVISSDPIIKHSLIVPLLYEFSRGMGSDYEEDSNSNVMGYRVSDVFYEESEFYENTIARHRPHVILADKKSEPILRKHYECQGRNIIIGGESYPFYSLDELESLHDEIQELAMMPYRGEVSPQVISVEEMERLKQEKVAEEIKRR